MTQEASMSPENKGTEEVRQFVEANKRSEIMDYVLACGDGRYKKDQSNGAIRAFGADFGVLMAVKATLAEKGIIASNQQILQFYWIARKGLFVGKDIITDIHTDEHNRVLRTEENPKMGCGHIAKAANPEYENLYGLKAYEVKQFYRDLLDFFDVKVTVLEGEHKEKGVLFIYGENEEDENAQWSVDSSNEKGEMYFVVDVARVKDFVKKITPRMGFKGLEYEDIERNFQKQMKATASILAGGLRQFDVFLTKEGKIENLEYKGDVPKAA